MKATRSKSISTGDECDRLLALINDENYSEIRLFASPTNQDHSSYSHKDGPDTNFPLVAAWAKCSDPQNGQEYVLFDGLFLTAARAHRYLDVKRLLDAAEQSNKVTYATARAPFTSSLDPIDAIDTLNVLSYTQFTPLSRAAYFSMVSNLTEQEFLNL